MIQLLSRTETQKGNSRILWQQANIGRGFNGARPYVDPGSGAIVYPGYGPIGHPGYVFSTDESCYYCRYKEAWTTAYGWVQCCAKHACEESTLPFIKLKNVLADSELTDRTNPDGTILHYGYTGIFKQATFEAQPHHVTLIGCQNGQAHCNANCFWHGWRLTNKRTWRQCGNSHLCNNDGSFWSWMAPDDPILFQEFIEQL